jgi:tRNA threonylcarbamoyladenosine biosynthesis protein TsaE
MESRNHATNAAGSASAGSAVSGLPPVAPYDSELILTVASDADAAGMVEVIHAAFGARPAVDPPSTAIDETPESVSAAIAACGAIYATVGGRPAGVILLADSGGGRATFRRVSVHPAYQRHGIASAMVAVAQDYAAELGFERVEVFARSEFAELIAYWQHRGFAVDRPEPYGVILSRTLPVCVDVPSAEAMRALGERLAALMQPGDLIIAIGDLGAGKTTLTQGIGRGLGAAGPIISPTFVLSRIHESADGRPSLVHVDAYRLATPAEVEDLDLDTGLERCVTVVEWGEGKAEWLAESRLEIDIRRDALATTDNVADATADDAPADSADDAPADSPDDAPADSPDDAPADSADDAAAADARTVLLRPVGPRWRSIDLSFLREPAP